MSAESPIDGGRGSANPGAGPVDIGIEVGSASASVHTLADGTRLRDYEIIGLVGEGGFGIVYLAFDPSLQRRVAIKEYMPSSMATRVAGSSEIRLKSERHAETFAAGLKSFVNEARLLARFDHPSLVKVYRFWEDNGTAYMVMPYYEGPTLKHALANRRFVPDEPELRALLRPLLSALAAMHAEHCFHRDIAPDNILLTAGGPLLLDFGAARRVIGDMTHALTVVLKPGFAPIEQYGEVTSMAQGAWTDLYALASVVYAAVTGKPPISSVERLMDDKMASFRELAGGRYSESFVTAIDAALALRPKDRPQDVAAFKRLLGGEVQPLAAAPEIPSAAPPVVESAAPEAVRPDEDAGPRGAPAETQADAPVEATFSPTVVVLSKPADAPPPPPPSAAIAAPAPMPAPAAAIAAPARRGRFQRVIAALGIVIIGVAALAYWAGRPDPVPTVDRTVERGAAAPAREASAPASAAAIPAPASVPAVPAASAVLPTASAPASRPARVTATAPSRPAPTAARATVVEPAASTPAHPAAPAPSSRCSDILQKASLGPLTAAETELLKRECR